MLALLNLSRATTVYWVHVINSLFTEHFTPQTQICILQGVGLLRPLRTGSRAVMIFIAWYPPTEWLSPRSTIFAQNPQQFIHVDLAEELLKANSGAEITWLKPHPLVLKYRDRLTVRGEVLEQDCLTSCIANKSNTMISNDLSFAIFDLTRQFLKRRR